MQKSTWTRKDKSDSKYTKPLPYIFTVVKKCRDGWGFVYLLSLLLSFLVHVLFCTLFLHLFSFLMTFLPCMYYILQLHKVTTGNYRMIPMSYVRIPCSHGKLHCRFIPILMDQSCWTVSHKYIVFMIYSYNNHPNGYQTVPFSVYIHNLMSVLSWIEWVFWKKSR